MGIGTSGAKNAVLFAAQILGTKHEKIKEAYQAYRAKLSEGQV
jgi:phosphoribosylcarboxyaminoimidazole (NCAIR) mutase